MPEWDFFFLLQLGLQEKFDVQYLKHSGNQNRQAIILSLIKESFT